MAAPATKRRKVGHNISEDEGDDASFASFGEEEDGENIDEIEADSENESMMDSEDDDGDDEMLGNGANKGQERPKQGTKTPQHRKTVERNNGSRNVTGGGTFVGNHKSAMFKLQMDELLEHVRPRHGKREKQAEEALHRIKDAIQSIPDNGPFAIDEAESKLLASSKVRVPFPDPRPPKDAKYKLEYARPANVNVVGSHVLKISSRAKKTLEIDMVVNMPSNLFQEKDFLNFRYFYKTAYYIASIAAGLNSILGSQFDIRFHKNSDDPLKPILVVSPFVETENEPKVHPAPKWQINIIPCVGENTFQAEKLYLDKACIRNQTHGSTSASRDTSALTATPFYNSSLRSDMLYASYLKLLHGTSKSCEAFRDACLLGNTWLRQRGFRSDIRLGGFGNFEFSAVMACLLQGGGPNGRPILSEGYSSYQLFKATVQLLALRDFSKQPFATDGEAPKLNSSKPPVFWDTQRKHNILYKMTPWSYRLLRQEARTTLNALSDQQFDGFDATFILKADGILHRYDYVLQIELAPFTLSNQESSYKPLGPYYQLYDILQKGLGDRAKCITIMVDPCKTLELKSSVPDEVASQRVLIGITTNAENAGRTIDHGPSAESKSEAAAFRKFWGDKAELRRFKDGSIQETLVWSGKESASSVVEQICRHLIQKNFGREAEEGMMVHGNAVRRLLPQSSAISIFQNTMDAFKQLENDIRSLDGLPLVVRQIMPADAQLRYASIRAPTAEQRGMPADVVLQFEGSSRWPDELVAIQRTKIAFLLKLCEQLLESMDSIMARLGLENDENTILNQGFLDVVYETGAAFRIRIHHDREQTLLERSVKDKATDPSERDLAVVGLAAYKRDYIKAPAHTQALARLCSRHPALSGTIRLLKKWFASHLLANHITDEVIELMAARAFVQPWPWEAPASVQNGLLRTLSWLSRWDWKAEPLIVDLSGSADLKPADIQSINAKFEAWRNLDPAMNRVVLFAASNVDSDGTTWTDGQPAKVVAARMTALARAACAEVAEKKLDLNPSALFESPLGDFDFVIRFDPVAVGQKKSRKQSKSNGIAFKNLELDLIDGSAKVGLDSFSTFLAELERLYGSAVLFFSGGHERLMIAGLWNPQTQRRNWKLNLSYSTTPVKENVNAEAQADVNKEAILAEIARLGGNTIQSIEVHR